jgi:hypothetical protein
MLKDVIVNLSGRGDFAAEYVAPERSGRISPASPFSRNR